MERRNNKRLISFMLQQEEGGFIPVYMFDHAEENSIPGLMLDISTGGCRILLSKTCTRLPETIHLKMLAPDQSIEVEADIEARECWSNDTYSIDHRSVGLKFTGQTNRGEIVDQLIECFMEHQKNREPVRCFLCKQVNDVET